ncbi:unnamed protein product [Cuscuta campestris]|uniref:Uncharacterized protein n=1 Tax=Cuscuta campestris TaxID=132261 RepID=A0A484MA55_9ASTE|nr:unnamed protein product [Cuscuta campestris]
MQVKSPSALHFSEGDRVESKSKEASHSSSRAKGQKRKGSQKSSKGDRKKKVRLSDTEGESIEEAFLSLAKKLSKAGVISEEIGQSLLEPKDQVSQLTILLDSAKLEINDRAERERRLEEELKEERARFALLEEERKRKIAELEDALGQALPGQRRRPFPLKLLIGLRAITRRLLKRDPSFDPAKMKLPALYNEEPAPPFPLE